ncbi:MAG: phage Gp37/Gp68 family protein, partial [Thioalkalivibrio sp.]|nr:phage Gp37/Gp68 family protein [Thioalkalivibrio sp.]
LKAEWVTSVRDQCRAHGTPFFFKQWGGVRKKAAGRLLEGRTYDEFPPVINAPIAARAERLEAISGIGASFATR